MKKLYFLDDEERQRILNIHESATKRQYLKEDEPNFGKSFDDINPLSAKNLMPGLKRDENWKTLYSCVPNQGVKPTTLKDGSKAYIINGFIYYNNGFKYQQPMTKGKGVKYSCDTEFKSNSSLKGDSSQDKSKKMQQYKQQIVAKTTDNTKSIQKLLGLRETGVMDYSLLQKINEKLNGGGQQAPTQTRPQLEPIQLTPAGIQPSPQNVTPPVQINQQTVVPKK